jgi:hypothetical protein
MESNFDLWEKDISYLSNPFNPFHLIGKQGNLDQGHALTIGFSQQVDILALHGSPLAMKSAVCFQDNVVDDQMTDDQVESVEVFEDPLG